MHIMNPNDPVSRHGLLRDIKKLERLVDDLKKLADGQMPSAATLAAAPLMDEYKIESRSDLCITGACDDHPLLEGPRIYTSSLWVFAPRLGWARTLSRWYRLGRPSSGGDHGFN
jgi:hypothetical protein